MSDLGASALVADRFSIDRLVDRGGMGVVYRAWDRRSGEPGDQVLVSVVLAASRAAVDGSSASPAAPLEDIEGFEAVRAAMARFNCPLDRLRDGSVVATILPPHSATDQARIAARCALALRDRMPGARLAVTTGPAPRDGSTRIGDAVDRAIRLVETEPESADGIRLDSLTAGLLDARFLTAARGEARWLLSENPDLDETRPLLGKPTPWVGREMDLVQLESLMAAVVEESLARVALVTGPPGIGKSRLRHELSRRLQGRYPSEVRCAASCSSGSAPPRPCTRPAIGTGPGSSSTRRWPGSIYGRRR